MTTYRRMLSAKIHRATVTHADLDYEGSLTLPSKLMEAANIKEYEEVSIWNLSNGERLETYAITGSMSSRDIAANGAAAHKLNPGDLIIIATFISVADDSDHKPILVFVDENNSITEMRSEIPGPN